jgi:hypothetical protein
MNNRNQNTARVQALAEAPAPALTYLKCSRWKSSSQTLCRRWGRCVGPAPIPQVPWNRERAEGYASDCPVAKRS